MPSTNLFRKLDLIARSDTSVLEEVDLSLQGVKTQLGNLHEAQVAFNTTLNSSVQLQTKTTKLLQSSVNALNTFLIAQTKSLLDSPEVPVPPLHPTIVLQRALIQSLNLITDKYFNLPENNTTLENFRESDLYCTGLEALEGNEELQCRFKAAFTEYIDAPDLEEQRCQRLADTLQLCVDIVVYFADLPVAPPE